MRRKRAGLRAIIEQVDEELAADQPTAARSGEPEGLRAIMEQVEVELAAKEREEAAEREAEQGVDAVG